MLNPSRSVAIFLGLLAFAAVVLGLATDVGLFGWTLAVLLGIYLGIAGIVRRARQGPVSPRRST